MTVIGIIEPSCKICDHREPKQGGHCYMFKEKPEGACGQFTTKDISIVRDRPDILAKMICAMSN